MARIRGGNLGIVAGLVILVGGGLYLGATVMHGGLSKPASGPAHTTAAAAVQMSTASMGHSPQQPLARRTQGLQAAIAAAKQGGPRAQLRLALMYADGTGVARSPTTAAKWLMASAEQGDATAQLDLGHAYMAGSGVPRDLDKAAEWLMLAQMNKDRAAVAPLHHVEGQMTAGAIDAASGAAARWRKAHYWDMPAS